MSEQKYSKLSARFLSGSFKGQLASVMKSEDAEKKTQFVQAINDKAVKVDLGVLSSVALKKLGEMGYEPAKAEVDKRTEASKAAKKAAKPAEAAAA